MRQIWLLLLPALLVLAAPAEARPRDDALSAAIRCGVVANSHQWLDCYYGAAQPVRAALGLGSALPAQIALAASPPGGGQPQDDSVRAEVVSAAAGCMRITEDRPWLDCYYGAAMPMRTQLGLSMPQAARAATVPAPTPVPIPMQQMASNASPPAPTLPPMPRRVGILGGVFSDPKPVVNNMRLQSYAFAKNGSFTITLEDGEIWEQNLEDEIYHRADWRREASDMRVSIKPDAMHTFMMTVYGQNYMYKVHRIH